jgi:hypothetical protein
MPLGVMLIPSLLAGVFQSTTSTVRTIRTRMTSPIFVQVVTTSLRSFRTSRRLSFRGDSTACAPPKLQSQPHRARRGGVSGVSAAPAPAIRSARLETAYD